MSATSRPSPTVYYVKTELADGEFTTLTKRSAREALATASEFKVQGLKVTVIEPGGASITEAELQARAAREAAY